MKPFLSASTSTLLLSAVLASASFHVNAAGVHGSEDPLSRPENRNRSQSPAAGVIGSDPFEPKITQEEGQFLAYVMRLLETDPVEAVRQLREERPDDSQNPALDFTLGNVLFQADDLEGAETAYRTALQKMPRFRAALMNLGRVLLLQDKAAETIKVYQRLVEDGQADADILQLLGHALMMEDAPVSAETAYRQAILLRPRRTEIRMGLAKALLRQERFREGLALIDEILKQDPLNQELWSLRVNALLSDEKYERATLAIESAHRLQRATPEMLATLGDLWLNQDQPEDALRAYSEAFAQEAPSVTRMLRALEGFLIVDSPEGAENMIKQISSKLDASRDPKEALRFLRLQADLALRKQEMDKAEAFLDQVLKSDPLDGRALLTLADLQHRQGNSAQALLTAERAARVEGFEAEALIRQARIEVSRGRYAKAVPLLEAAQAFSPQDSVARYLEQVRRLAQ